MRKTIVISILLSLMICLVPVHGAEEADILTATKDHPWFGINLEDSIEKKVEEIPNGALIKEVIAGSNAEKMGLVKKDIVKKVDGVEVTSVDAFIEEVFKKKPGEKVTLAVFRNGENLEISFQLEDFHKRADGALESLGFTTKSFNIDNVEGVIVASVAEGSYADYGGLLVNDLIMALDHSDFSTLGEFEIVLSNINLEQPVDLMIIRQLDNQKVIVPLKIGPQAEEETKNEAAASPPPKKPSGAHGLEDYKPDPH